MTEATATKKTPKLAPEAPEAPVSEASKPRSSEAKKLPVFAVIATGGKQYRVKVGDLLKIEKLQGELKEGDKITFDSVLMTDDGASAITLGAPFIKGLTVSATLNKIARYKTIDVIKYKQKSRYFKKYGHRQPYFEVRIDSIN